MRAENNLEGEWIALSTAQLFHWRLTERDPASFDQKIVLPLLVRGVTADAVERAIRKVAHKHAALRVRFVDGEGGVRQCVTSSADLKVARKREENCDRGELSADVTSAYETWYDKIGLAARSGRVVAHEIVAAKRMAFRLREELPLRATLIAHGDVCSTVILSIHHIACDAYSFARISSDFEAFLKGQALSCDVDMRYFAYAHHQSSRLDVLADEQLRYWCDLLTSAPRLAGQTFLDKAPEPCLVRTVDVSSAMNNWGQRSHMRTLAKFMSAFARALNHCGLLDQTYVLSTVSNRDAKHTDVVGCFYRHLIWCPPSQTEDLSLIASQFISQATRSLPRLDVALDMIEAAFAERTGARAALQVCLSLRDFGADAERPGALVTRVPLLSSAVEQRIGCHVHVTREGGRWTVTQVTRRDYCSPVVADAIFEDMARNW